MLEGGDQSWFGTDARLELWRKVDDEIVLGPVLYESVEESADQRAENCKFRL